MILKINKTTILTAFIVILTFLISCNSAESKTTLQGTISDNYPQLSSTPLGSAKFAKLPKGVLARSGNITIRKQELDQEIASAQADMRQQLEQNAFFILEQKFTEKVLIEESRTALTKQGRDVKNLSDMELVQTFIRGMVEHIEPTVDEISNFYEANKELMGGMPLERVQGQIASFLTQQKQQEIVQDYITNLLSDKQVEISETWGSEKIVTAMNNDVDKARLSGKPTMANFGSDSCVPCQMMIPAREAIKETFGNSANVVYVHVDKEQILSSRYGVQSIPTLIFFDMEGKEVHSHVGMMSEEEMEERLKAMLN